jgi:thiol-disulfide isomerase/thioredoxin
MAASSAVRGKLKDSLKNILISTVIVVCALATGYGCGREDSRASAPASSPSGSVASSTDLVAAVRAAGTAKDFTGGADLVAAHRATNGVTPENLEALSWLGRTALAAGELDRAERFAQETYELSGGLLRDRALDAEPRLPIALGAAIEVLGQVGARRGARTEAVAFLESEVDRYRQTSIAKRIQKNINLISLEGTVAPALDLTEQLGPGSDSLDSLRGRVVLMFFWAHWCSDCKAQAPVLATLQAKYRDRGLVIVAPTQRFGYVAEGRTAAPDEERTYIDQIRRQHYPALEGMAIPLSPANHLRYGVSTTPTLVVVDRAGVVRLYRPGLMKEADIEPIVHGLIEADISPSTSG